MSGERMNDTCQQNVTDLMELKRLKVEQARSLMPESPNIAVKAV